MIDYELKAKVISNGLTKKISALDKKNYLNCKEGIIYDYDLEESFINLLLEFGGKQIKEARKVNHSYYQRAKRLRDRISSYLVKGQCIFATFTFTDDVLQKTNVKTRRKYISRFCKSVSDYYVANIDYGVDDNYTHREHYHALLLTPFISDKWDYGFTWFEKVAPTCDSDILLSKYISKLTNHAIKDSTRRNTYIYSRNITR